MNDLTYVGTILARQREAELAREIELMRSHRERGVTLTRPHGLPLAAWFRAAIDRVRSRTAATA
jgi:hypothetical protein